MNDLLAQVHDPYLGDSLAALGARLSEDGRTLQLTLPYAGRGAAAELQAAIEQVWEGEPPRLALDVDIAAVAPAVPKPPIEGVKNIILVTSAKGGVGKSTVAANLALALAAEGARVGMLDADLYGPSQAKMFGLEEQRPQVDGERMKPVVGHGVQVASIASHLNREDAPLIWRGAQLHTALQTLLRQTQWDAVDYLIVDTPPGTGDVHLTLTQQIPIAGAVVVSTPQEIALLDARKGLKMFKQLGVPVLGVIENMNMFICPACGHEEHIFGHDGAQLMSLQYLVNFIGSLPLDRRIQAQTDAGTPTVIAEPDSRIAELFRQMARKVSAAAILASREREAVVPQTEEDLRGGQVKEIRWNL